MQSRRTFIGRLAAAIGGVLALPFAAKAATKLDPKDVVFYVTGWDSKINADGTFNATIHYATALDVTGKPTPPELIKGVLGITYLKTGHWHTRHVHRVHLDGNDVTNLASEVDLDAGWVRMFEMYKTGKMYKTGQFSVERIHFGHVEIR